MRIPGFLGFAVVCLGALGAADVSAVAPPNCYVQTNLVASPDGPPAPVRDPNLVNSWGIATTGNGLFWTANNGTSTATLYRSNGSQVPSEDDPLVVSVPGAPTGIVQNSTPGFAIQSEGRVASSNLIFVTESGTVLGYNPVVEPTAAVVAVDFAEFGSVFKGAALFPGPFGSRLYATDFANGLVQIFDDNFELMDFFENDPLPHDDFAPFNVATLGNSVFVAFAKQQAGSTDEQHGPGLGFIDQFTTEGRSSDALSPAVCSTLPGPWSAPRSGSGGSAAPSSSAISATAPSTHSTS